MVNTHASSRSIKFLREYVNTSACAGLALSLVMGFVWLEATLMINAVRKALATWRYSLHGSVATPVSIVIGNRLRYVVLEGTNAFTPRVLQLSSRTNGGVSRENHLWEKSSSYAPAMLASNFRAHFLLFQWVYRARMNLYLGLAASIGAIFLVWLLPRRALHIVGLNVCAMTTFVHAANEWDDFWRGWPIRRNGTESSRKRLYADSSLRSVIA